LPIRPEDRARLGERSSIRAIHEAAFDRMDEADLVDRLRDEGHAILSLVAELDGRIAGHILFSRMRIDTPKGPLEAVALAPLAVLPVHQRRGIGGQLIERGLELLRERGEKIVIVLGHPGYYPRFGFSAAKASALRSPFPPEAFMAIELSAGALNGVSGGVVYPPPFGIEI
jgi:putative acetyltransferase